MTVQEAKGFIQGKIDCMDRCDVFDCKHTDECENCNYCYSQGNFGEQKEAFKFAIECMEELEQYRALGTVEQLEWCKDASHWKSLYKEKLEQYESLGTVEELKEAREKQIPKKVAYKPQDAIYQRPHCPTCDKELFDDNYIVGYCECGQALKWGEE